MEHAILAAPTHIPPYAELERVYLIQATIKTFKGRRDVLVHLFRCDTDEAELTALRGLDLVGSMGPDTPDGASAEQALRSLLEAFTAEEGNALLAYLEKRYSDHITHVSVSPQEFPLPLGVVPFASIPEGRSMGFIRFEAVPDYDLPFVVRGFYDLDAHAPLVGE